MGKAWPRRRGVSAFRGGGRGLHGNNAILAFLGVLVLGVVLMVFHTRNDLTGANIRLEKPHSISNVAEDVLNERGVIAGDRAASDALLPKTETSATESVWEPAGPGTPGYPRGQNDIHVVFSTDCTKYQAWQAIVLFHSAHLSNHTGPITQLVSGCSDEEQETLIARHRLVRHSDNHHLFFSPDFTIRNPLNGEPYPYLNKPNAMQLWMQETEIPETIIALIDPDFIFLKPLTTFMSAQDTVVKGDGLSLEGLRLEDGGWIRKDFPAGQRFGLPNWTRWDRSSICPAPSPCETATTAVAKRYYDLIPPYLMHKDDWITLLPEWVEHCPKVYAAYPSLLAEQTAYATAAAAVNLRHYRINNYAVENEKVDYEAWDAVDHGMSDVCAVGIEEGDGASRDVRTFSFIPHFIHYCHMYRVGAWLFNKRRYRKTQGYDQLNCQTPLLAYPPHDIQEKTFKIHPGGKHENISKRSAKRNAFVLCVATRFVNSALRRFKTIFCSEGNPVFEETVKIV